MVLDSFLRDIVVIFGVALAVTALCRLLRIPALVGLLLTGCLVGPYGARLIGNPGHVETIAEVGVVFLLFEIGLEISFKRLKSMGRIFFAGGSLQVFGTIAVTAAAALLFGRTPMQAVFFGLILSLSSTAIVLRLYADRRETESPHAGIGLALLLFQDILVVPFMLVVPLLGGSRDVSAVQLFVRLAIGCAVISAVFALSRFLVPRLLHYLAASRARELLVIGSLFLCLGAALITKGLGFSLALGAFLAGILIAESDYRHQVIAETMPFRDVFNSVFFVSIGMLLKLDFVASHPFAVTVAVFLILALKGAPLFGTVRLLAFPSRIAVLVAMGLSQIGEFAFVLLLQGRAYGVIGEHDYQLLIAASILSMALTPFLIGVSPVAAGWAGNLDRTDNAPASAGLSGHVIIVGFGLAGRHLARVLKVSAVPYVIVELNGDTVRKAKQAGEPIMFGDASRKAILDQCGIRQARFIIFVIPDPQSLQQAARLAREMNPGVFIIARARMQADIEGLRQSGVDEVVSAEFETSIEILTNVLTRLAVPGNLIRSQTRLLRQDDYTMLRSPSPNLPLSDNILRALSVGTTDTFLVTETLAAASQTIRDIDLRKKTGATIIALVRDGKPFTNPSPDMQILAGDLLVLVGSHAQIDAAFGFLEKPPPESPAA